MRNILRFNFVYYQLLLYRHAHIWSFLSFDDIYIHVFVCHDRVLTVIKAWSHQ